MLDAVATRYGADPWTVAEWTPARLGLAIEAMEAGIQAEMAARSEAQRQSAR